MCIHFISVSFVLVTDKKLFQGQALIGNVMCAMCALPGYGFRALFIEDMNEKVG